MERASEDAAFQILVCDDSVIERQGFARLLRAAGYDVLEAADGLAAIEILRHNHVDLALLDLNMPEIDGFGVLRYVQENRQSLPVVVLSGMQPDNIQDGIHKLSKHELPTLLMKPVTPEQLLAVVDLSLSGQLREACDAAAR